MSEPEKWYIEKHYHYSEFRKMYYNTTKIREEMENKGVMIDPPIIDWVWEEFENPKHLPLRPLKGNGLTTMTYAFHIESVTKEYLQERLIFESQCFWWIETISKQHVVIRVTNGVIPKIKNE